jgi:hypothetical protein
MVNDGIKDGTESTTRRPKPSQGIQSDPLHTDTLSVSELKTGIPGISRDVPGLPEARCTAVDLLLWGRPMRSRQNPDQQKIVVV